MQVCEIIYSNEAKGWKWRLLPERQRERPVESNEAFALFYECVTAARSKGYRPNVRCL
jgi:hypothetical protein